MIEIMGSERQQQLQWQQQWYCWNGGDCNEDNGGWNSDNEDGDGDNNNGRMMIVTIVTIEW